MEPRIILEKMVSEDFSSFYSLVGNEKVMAMITEKPLSEEEARKKFNTLMQNNKLHPSFGSFKVLDVSDANLLGFAKLEITEDKREAAELGFMLLPEFWSRGFGSEIAEILMQVANSNPGLKRVYAIIDPENVGSRKILRKNGFTSEEVGKIDGLPSEILARSI